MGVKIDFSGCKNGNVTTSNGVRIFNSSGDEINGVESVKINVKPNSLVTAEIITNVESVSGLDFVTAEFPNLELSFIESEVEKHGYKLVKK